MGTLPPFIEADELVGMAAKYAGLIVDELDQLNKKYPRAKLAVREDERLREKFGDEIPGFLPKDFMSNFEAMFCHYLASRSVLLPPEP